MAQFWTLSAHEIAALVQQRKASAREVVGDALARLEAVNPAINAVVTEMPQEALAAAEAIDRALARGEPVGPLAGVPVTIKVNVDQAGHTTTNGLRLQKDLVATTDSPVVANLKAAGAVVIGRTNTPAFSLRWFTRNSLHGATRNPVDPTRTPGGSSGGAAAAVAAGIGALAHGTDIAGSVRYPAYACGVHGLRPTLGRVPAINFSSADRHIGAQLMAVSGPLARTIDDVALAFAAMCRPDPRDPWYMPVAADPLPWAKRAALTIHPDGLQTAPEVAAALGEAARRLKDAGWDVVETDCPALREPAHLQLMLWLAEYRRTAAEAVQREGDPDAQFVYRQLAEIAPAPTLDGFMDALQRRMGLVRQWQEFLDRYPVLLCPVSGELPFPDQLDVESPASFRRVFEAQLPQVGLPFMGLPGLTVTTGRVGHAPVGVQLAGRRYGEAALLAAGAAIAAGGPAIRPVDPAI